MKVKIKKLHPDAVMPFKEDGHDTDFCYDVVSVSDAEPVYDKETGEVIEGIWKYHTGLAFEMVYDNTFLSKIKRIFCKNDTILDIDGRARSSIYKTGLSLCNCIATVDDPYRGEVCFFFYEVIKGRPKYKKGDKIGQICINATTPMNFEWSDSLSSTVRGEGGFGSTDKK